MFFFCQKSSFCGPAPRVIVRSIQWGRYDDSTRIFSRVVVIRTGRVLARIGGDQSMGGGIAGGFKSGHEEQLTVSEKQSFLKKM